MPMYVSGKYVNPVAIAIKEDLVKSGRVTRDDFSGIPLKAKVLFKVPWHIGSAYAVTCTPIIDPKTGSHYQWTVEDQTGDGFTINLNSGLDAGLIAVDWVCQPHRDV